MAGKLKLTNENYKWLSGQLNCEPEMVISVSKVECKRDPFDSDGFPAILFERHIFYKYAPRAKRSEWAAKYPDICNSKPTARGGYGSYAVQRTKFSKAFHLDNEAAMEACSWGAFQELGANYSDYGYNTVGEFVDTMKDGLGGQAEIFIKSIKKRGLVDDMQAKRFDVIARLYNGTEYRKFNYDGQLSDEYKAAKRLKIDWSKIKAVEPEHKQSTDWIGSLVEPIANFADLSTEDQQATDASISVAANTAIVNTATIEPTDPEPKIEILTNKIQQYVPQDIQDQIKDGVVTGIKARLYTWIQLVIAILSAIAVWLANGGWMYIILIIAIGIIGFQLYSWLVVWLKNRDRDRIAEIEKLKIEFNKLVLANEHEKLMFEAKSSASRDMDGIRFVPATRDAA